MKKFTVLALALLLVVAFTVPASALENIFGGYWRTRMFQQRNFDGDGGTAADTSRVDTRTRLYYTAKINDNLKFVNKFEFDTVWGDNVSGISNAGVVGNGQIGTSTYGRVGTDGIAIEVKNSYADWNMGPVNVLVGAQPFTLARGFISDEDAAGAKVIWKINEGLYLPFIWEHLNEGDINGLGLTSKKTSYDVDAYVVAPIIMLSKDIKINPYWLFAHSQNATYFSTVAPAYAAGTFNNLNAHMIGLDADAKFGAVSVWFTGILQRGTAQVVPAAQGATAGDELDLRGYLAALGGTFNMGKADVHGQFFWASGEDKAQTAQGLKDGKVNAFVTTGSTYYYWAEILGMGIFDNQSVTGSNNFRVSNTRAINLGATLKPMDKLKIAADLWYATLDQKNVFGEKKLGLETDLVVTYTLVEGLNLDIVGAYLFAGDAVSADGKNDTNPYEFGTRLSLSF